MKIITISRQYGAGGREIGLAVGKELGVTLYDRDIIAAIAEEIGMKSEFRNIAWDGIFASLESGQANVIASCVTIQYRDNYPKIILKSFGHFSVIPP